MRLRGDTAKVFPRVAAAVMVALAATALSLSLFIRGGNKESSLPAAALQAGRALPLVTPSLDTAEPAPAPVVVSTSLDRSARITTYLTAAGLDHKTAQKWAAVLEKRCRLWVMRRGHRLTLYEDPETGELRGIRYDSNRRTELSEVNLGDGVLIASRHPIQYAERPVSVAFSVSGSFTKAAASHQIPRKIVGLLRTAFSSRCSLDKMSPGSTVKLIYTERVSRDGVYSRPIGVDAAEIHTAGKTLTAFAFRDTHGQSHMYDASGRSLGLVALRFPVKFLYISSGFSYHRYHPILHIYRPHLGVDLAARYGTPVESIADGKVLTAGWCGELGRCVRIAHAKGIISIYGHLSKIHPGVHPGTRVHMGEVIGRVGSSGLSSGPHLHFAIERHDHFVNPLLQKIGENHRISPRMQALFEKIKRRYMLALSRLPSLGPRSAEASEGDASAHDLELTQGHFVQVAEHRATHRAKHGHHLRHRHAIRSH